MFRNVFCRDWRVSTIAEVAFVEMRYLPECLGLDGSETPTPLAANMDDLREEVFKMVGSFFKYRFFSPSSSEKIGSFSFVHCCHVSSKVTLMQLPTGRTSDP